MKRGRAIAILMVPFAVTTMILLAGMCLTPYWDCSATDTLSTTLIAPLLFLLSIFAASAVVILYVDLLLVARLSIMGISRILAVGFIGAAVAVFPRICLAAIGGQGLGALNPQLEYLPFVVSGAFFAVLADRLTLPQLLIRDGVSHDA